MNRRRGQNGTIVIQSGWYRVRWRMDVEGQTERSNMTEKIAPVVFDKNGNPKPASPEVRRMMREIVERSGANSEERFNRVVLGEATFGQQAKTYVKWATTRDREPIKDICTIQGALDKWILPVLGDLPLANINNISVKVLVDKMKDSKSLSPCSIGKYVDYVKQVVASLRDGDTGEPIHRRTWDSAVMDLPLVNQREQRRPSLKAPAVNQLVQESEGEEQAVYVLEGATGMRISEALALEAKHFVNGGRTIIVRQQVARDGARIVDYVKTDAAFREVDLYTPVAEYLRSFIGKDGLLFRTRNGTPHLHNNLEGRWLTPRLQAMGLEVPGMGWHAFKRFRKTWLRGKRCQEDVNNYWLAHKPKTMSELYSHMHEELELRLAEAEQVGVGFDVPAYCAPKCSNTSVESEVAVAA